MPLPFGRSRPPVPVTLSQESLEALAEIIAEIAGHFAGADVSQDPTWLQATNRTRYQLHTASPSSSTEGRTLSGSQGYPRQHVSWSSASPGAGTLKKGVCRVLGNGTLCLTPEHWEQEGGYGPGPAPAEDRAEDRADPHGPEARPASDTRSERGRTHGEVTDEQREGLEWLGNRKARLQFAVSDRVSPTVIAELEAAYDEFHARIQAVLGPPQRRLEVDLPASDERPEFVSFSDVGASRERWFTQADLPRAHLMDPIEDGFSLCGLSDQLLPWEPVSGRPDRCSTCWSLSPLTGEEISVDVTCHCGQPLAFGYDGDPTHTRGMCERCDSVRCDAYPGACQELDDPWDGPWRRWARESARLPMHLMEPGSRMTTACGVVLDEIQDEINLGDRYDLVPAEGCTYCREVDGDGDEISDPSAVPSAEQAMTRLIMTLKQPIWIRWEERESDDAVLQEKTALEARLSDARTKGPWHRVTQTHQTACGIDSIVHGVPADTVPESAELEGSVCLVCSQDFLGAHLDLERTVVETEDEPEHSDTMGVQGIGIGEFSAISHRRFLQEGERLSDSVGGLHNEGGREA